VLGHYWLQPAVHIGVHITVTEDILMNKAIFVTILTLLVSACSGLPSVQRAKIEANKELELKQIEADARAAEAKYKAIGEVAKANASAKQYTDSAVFEKINKPDPKRTNQHDVDIEKTKQRHATARSVVPAIVNPLAIYAGAKAVAGAIGDKINLNGDGDIKVNKGSIVDSDIGRDATLGNKTANKSVVDSDAGGDNSGRDKKTDTDTTTDNSVTDTTP